MEKRNISIVVAISQNYAIGRNNNLLWHISDDLKHFKEITLGHPVIMGRKTYDSLLVKPLPERRNIVLSRDSGLKIDQFEVVHSVEEALDICSPSEETFVIGGEHIYKQFMPYVRKMYVTWVYENFEADAYFPEINPMLWEIADQSEIYTDKKTGLQYAYFIYKRRRDNL